MKEYISILLTNNLLIINVIGAENALLI